MIELYLIRHGECEFNLKPELVGGRQNSSPLTENGRRQACLLGKRLAEEGIVFDDLLSSPAIRALETARTACRLAYGLPLEIVVSDQLQELSQGSWECRKRDEVYTPDVIEVINQDPLHFRAPYGESQYDVENRALGLLESISSLYAGEDISIGVFTHGMFIKCLLHGIYRFPSYKTRKISIDNTSITSLRYEDYRHEQCWRLVSLNDRKHLGPCKDDEEEGIFSLSSYARR